MCNHLDLSFFLTYLKLLKLWKKAQVSENEKKIQNYKTIIEKILKNEILNLNFHEIEL
jgi:hypothetical protein